MKKMKVPVLSIVLYVLAGLFLIYTIWAVVESVKLISSLVEMGQLQVSGSEFDLANYFMDGVGRFLAFTAILFSLGWFYQNNVLITVEDLDEEFEVDEFEEIEFDLPLEEEIED